VNTAKEDTKKLEDQYQAIYENADNKVWKDGDCPEALGDSPMAEDLKPDNNCSTDDSECVTGGKPLKPEDENEYYLNKISERLKESTKKTEKSGKKEINNFETMSEDNTKNIFDKLYSTIMEGDNPFEDLDSMGGDAFGDEEDLGGGDELDIGGDEVSFSLPREQAQQLCDALTAALGGDEGDEIEDMDGDLGDEGGFDDEMLGDAVVSKPDPAPVADGVPGLTGKSNKTGGAGYSNDSGSAETGNIKEDPTPKPLGKGNHGSPHEMEHKKDNKVNNPKTKALGD
jgi:hypothetical protein